MTALVQAARLLAHRAHQGQVDKQGRDYYAAHLEPIARSLRPFGLEAEAAGWLHDIIEDTDVSYEDLLRAGVPRLVVDAVQSVTRQDGEPYMKRIAIARAHPLGRVVKLADNWLNLSGLDALALIDPIAATRLRRKYEEAREYLTAWDVCDR